MSLHVRYRIMLLASLVLSLQPTLFAAPDDIRSVTWEKITHVEPIPGLDVNTELARLRRDLERQGATLTDSSSFRRSLEQDRAGSSRRELQTWITDGETIRRDFSYGEPVSLPRDPLTTPFCTGYVMEHDGLYVSVTASNETDSPPEAMVRYGLRDQLLYTGEDFPAFHCLVFGTSPERIISSPYCIRREKTKEGIVVTLQKTLRGKFMGQPAILSSPLTMTISPDGTRLLGMKRSNYQTVTTEKWEQVKTGIWVPRMIQVITYTTSPNGVSRVSTTERYKRLQVSIGKAVSVAPLREPFFRGETQVVDYRYDTDDGEQYIATRNPLPENEASRRYAKRRREKTLSVFLPQLLGILAVGGLVIGLILKIRRGDE